MKSSSASMTASILDLKLEQVCVLINIKNLGKKNTNLIFFRPTFGGRRYGPQAPQTVIPLTTTCGGGRILTLF